MNCFELGFMWGLSGGAFVGITWGICFILAVAMKWTK